MLRRWPLLLVAYLAFEIIGTPLVLRLDVWALAKLHAAIVGLR